MSSCSASGGGSDSRPSAYKAVGISLAVASGVFIGTSFVLKKTGLLKANVKYHEEAGEGYGYLKNAWWWSGMTLMILGEICNFVAYSFVDAILVTPLGALSVVITTILSAIFLKERLSFVGKVGCFNCIVGSVVILLNAPQQSAVGSIQEMQCYVISPGFLSYAGVILVGCAIVALWAGPRYGKKSMLVYLTVCSLIGGLSVVATQGLGAAIVKQIQGTGAEGSQFKQWFLYVLFVFVIATLLTEIIYLNKALNIFNAALVTPTYYVYFTSATIVTSAILFRGFKGTPMQIATIIMGFLQICAGVVLLQLSKSSKDVPDTKVFSGDLDQVRTVAEQEEHESEPKADTLRGTAALLRSVSKTRKQHEIDEAKRVQSERLEPIGENETIEWDGLRRRKTVLQPGETPLRRQKTLHPPLGLTHFPSNDNISDRDPAEERHPHAGLFNGLRGKANTVFHPGRTPNKTDMGGRTASGSSAYSSTLQGDLADSKDPVHLAQMSSTRQPSGQSTTSSDTESLMQRPHVYGLPASLHNQDTSYKSPTIQWADGEAAHTQSPDSLEPPSNAFKSPGAGLPPRPPPHKPSPRSFSFQNVFSKGSRSSDQGGSTSPTHLGVSSRGSTDNRPTSSASSTGRSSIFGRFGSGRNQSGTEEERLGLVVPGQDNSLGRNGRLRGASAGSVGGLGIQEERDSEAEDSDASVRRSRHVERRSGAARKEYDDDFDDEDFEEGNDELDSSETEDFERIGMRDLDGRQDGRRGPPPGGGVGGGAGAPGAVAFV